MEIGIDASRAFQGNPTGIGTYATQVISRLLAQPPARLRLYLNRRTPPAGVALPPGSEWRPIPMARGWTQLRLRWELHRDPPELLWIPAYRLPRGRLPRSVVTVHGVEHRFAPAAYPTREARAIESFVEDSLRRAARLICPSETTKADLVNLFQADAGKITVIPHGMSEQLRPLTEEESRPWLERLSVRSPYFLMVGAHHPRKNVVFLMERFEEAFPGTGAGPQLVVTNAPSQAPASDRAAAGLGQRLQLLGHVSGEGLSALYSQARAVCVPSLYEGFGLPALEAMACAAPVLGNDVGAVQEIAEGAALLLPLEDREGWVLSLRRLLEDDALQGHLGQLGRARAERFSWERSAASHRALLARELELARA